MLPEGYVFPLGGYFVDKLLCAGHSVTIVTTDVTIKEKARFTGERLQVVVLPRRSAGACAKDFFRREVEAIGSAIREIRPEIVHAQWTYEFADGARRSGSPMIATAHDSAPAIFRYMRDAYRLARLLYSYLVVPRIRLIALPSPYLARQYELWYLRRDAVLIPNGLREEDFASRLPSHRRSGLNVVSVTGWDERKNPKVLLRAFALVRKARPQMRLILFGDGLGRGENGALWAARNGLDEGVEFRGRVGHESAMSALQTESDLFVHTTLEESFCMAVVEAMASGVPVVAGRNSGAVPWILGNGRWGKLVDVHNPASVASGILDVAADRHYAEAMAQSAYAAAREKFTLGAMVGAYMRLYEAVVSRAKSS